MWSHQRLVNWMCTLVLKARSVGSPSTVQYSQLLKFHLSDWKIRLGVRNARAAQLVHSCWSAWSRNPMSLISKPGERRW